MHRPRPPMSPRPPMKTASSPDDVQNLMNQVSQLEKRLARLQKCVQVDATGQNLTLKVPANITIEAGMDLNIKGGMTITLIGHRIELN